MNGGFLAAFSVRSFRFQFSADLLTAWAIEMEVLVLGWFVLTETDSPFLLALIGVARFGGTLLTPLLGALADRLPRRRMLIAIRFVFTGLSAGMATLALTGAVAPIHAFAVAILSGLLRPADMMLRQSLVGDTVPNDTLMNAMGFARTTLDSARIFGALAGASLLATLGIGAAYVTVAIFYAASALFSLGIARVNSSAREAHPGQSALWQALYDLREGVRFVKGVPRIQALLWVAFLVNFCGLCITGGLLPVVARDLYGMDELGLGILVATFAGGALAGSLLVATFLRAMKTEKIMLISVVVWHLLLIVFSYTETPAIGIALLGVIGLLSSVAMIPLASILLVVTSLEYRGRVMGLRQLAVFGLPLGLLVAGTLIEAVNISTALGLLSAVGVISGVLLLVKWSSWTAARLT